MNYRCKMGEVDIIARDGEYLCFVEVKYREHMGAGSPEAAVDFRKQKRICRVCEFYMLQHHLSSSTAVRFDVVAILQEEIHLHKNAFSYIGNGF